MASSRKVWPLALVVLLAACVQGATVTIDATGGKVDATVSRGEKRACVDDLDVVEVRERGGEPLSGAWHIATADIDRCVSRFILGEVPAGFVEDAPLAPLVPGRRYRVEVSGTGFMGAETFTARPSGPGGAPSNAAPSPAAAR